MTTLMVDLPTDLVARIERLAAETGQSLDTLVAEALAARFTLPAPAPRSSVSAVDQRIRLRPVRFAGWPLDATFRREEIYGDDAR